MRRARWAVAAAVAVCAVAASVPAQAQKARVLVVVKESVEDRELASKGAEPALSKALIDDGFQVVERYESEGVRSRIPLERILDGRVEGNEVSAINADLLVVGRVYLEKEDMPYGIKGKAYTGSIEVRVLLTDSGRVVYSGRKSAKGAGNASDVAAKLAGRIVPELMPAVEKALGSREVIEVRVAGLKSAGAADALATRIGAAKGVQSAKVRVVSADVTIIDVRAKGMQARALGAALEAAGLEVTRRSANVIEASYDALAAARRSVLVGGFDNKTGKAALAWIADVAPDIAETELTSSEYLSPADPPASRPASSKAAAAAARKAGADVAIVGAVQTAGGKLRISAAAVRAKDGRTLVSVQVFADGSTAMDAVKELVWKLDQQLYKKLNKKSSLRDYRSRVRKYLPREASSASTAPAPTAHVVVADAQLEAIFPAQLARYAAEPFGTVTLENTGKRRATSVRLAVTVGDLGGDAQSISVGDIPGGRSVAVPLRVVFDRDKLIDAEQQRPVRVELAVSYDGGDDKITEATVLHDRNAMNWGEGDALAAFVTHRDPYVLAFSQSVLAAAGNHDTLPTGLAGAVALFDALQALGIRYRRDPMAAYGDQAVDAVYFPRETLASRAGDCDDLAVLYAAMLAATGRGVRIVYTPGHVFVAVDSELSMAKADILGGAARTLDIGGRAWVPVEVTKLEGGFMAAWNAGVVEINRYRGDADKIRYVDIGMAWGRYPAFPIRGEASPPAAPKSLAKRVAADVTAIVGGRYTDAGKPLPNVSGAHVVDADALAASDPRRLVRLGADAGKRGDTARALAYLTRASEVDSGKAVAMNNLGNVYALLRQWREAIKAYEQAERDKSIRSKVLVNKGYAHYELGDRKAARKALLAARSPEARALMKDLGLGGKRRGPKSGKPDKSGGSAASSSVYGMRAGAARVETQQVLIWLD